VPREGDGASATLDPLSQSFSRAATAEDLKRLVEALNANRVDYLLIGGYALHAHGYQRATTDIDLMVPADREHGTRVKKALLLLPDKAAADIDPAWFEDGENIRVADAFVVDLMLNAGGETYESMQPYAVTIDFDGIPVRTLSLEGLLKTKQRSSREKDAADRAVLERALRESSEG
jgi:hypothetical protein